ncbi:MAG: glycoside hydrolase family 127 protein, partial [Verrucomicrobia bacterium]|nr:glycoside hydrolase family 127 protein [Verrucomicrobiota bacterium]
MSSQPGWQPVNRSRVQLAEGFWKQWRKLVGEVTLSHELNQMRHQGHVDALDLDQRMHRGRKLEHDWYWGGSIFWDSDLAKWLEAAAGWLECGEDKGIDRQIDEIVAKFQKAQLPDGYVNSHILTWRPNHRFKNLRDLHELYCAGHLIEAAVVHNEATGKTNLLEIACRFADHLCSKFGTAQGQLRGYPGHPEIELALMRLYQLTRETRYLDLARFFIEERGRTPNYFDEEAVRRVDDRPFRPQHPGSPYAYMQAHEPIRQQRKVVGHAVRAMYLYSAVAELALELGDDELRRTCQDLWTDLVSTKLYITGGIGSDAENEGFTSDYDLPNEKAYAETCASIGLFFFGHRMLRFGPDRMYSDITELALYNNILSGIGLDGKTFFYDNPLSSRGDHHRVAWPWWCPCCPPNLARLITSLSGYLCSENANRLAFHQYINSDIQLRDNSLQLRTGFPFDGKSEITIRGPELREFTLVFRVPGWAGDVKAAVNGETVPPTLDRGYLHTTRSWKDGDRVTLDFEMPVRKHYARYEVSSDRGRVAITRGPLVYCLETADNGDRLDEIVLSTDAVFEHSTFSGIDELSRSEPGSHSARIPVATLSTAAIREKS